MIKDNPLIERIRDVRHQISAEYNHDPKQLVEHYIELEKKHQDRFVDLERIYREPSKVPVKKKGQAKPLSLSDHET
jgi:hypothetical protein